MKDVNKNNDLEYFEKIISQDVSIDDNEDTDEANDGHHIGHGKAEGTFGGDEIEPYNEDEEGGGQQPPPPIDEPEFPEEPIEDIINYKMRFPIVTEMIYGVKICNSSSEQEAKSVEKRLFVGVGIAICRSLMEEAGIVGESILSAKKDSYSGVFEILATLFSRRDEYDCDGNLIMVTETLAFDDGEEDLRKLILADKFMVKTLPILAIFNKDLFNEKQVSNLIDFCMSKFREKHSVLVSEKYTDETASPEDVWGFIFWNGEDRKNYKINYYLYVSKQENYKPKKTLKKIEVIVVNKGNLDFSVDLDSMGDEFYGFVWAMINNYINNSTQTIEQQTYNYKNKKNVILDSANDIFEHTTITIEREVEKIV